MYSLVNERNKPNLIVFKTCCFLVSVTYAVQLFTGYSSIDWIMIPIIFCMIGLLLNMFMFTARMIESVANGYLVNRSDSLKAFFGFWFFPVGIWYIQPAVQRLVKENEVHIQGNGGDI
jgi:hypothetical protein